MAGRQMSCRQQTAPQQLRCSKDVTAHPHLPRARPGSPCPVPACSGQPLPGKRRFRSPLRNRISPVNTPSRSPLLLPLLQAHRETEAHFTAIGLPSQHNQSDLFCFKCAAFFQSLKSKVRLTGAKTAALRIKWINLNVEGGGIVAEMMMSFICSCRYKK
jgi:hypothetical protein